MVTDWNKWFGREHPPALQEVLTLQSTWTDCPVEIQEIISALWRTSELGNDNYVLFISIKTLKEWQAGGITAKKWYWTEEDRRGWVKEPLDLIPLIDYLIAHGVAEDREVWVHHWW